MPDSPPDWRRVDGYGLVAICFLLSGFAALLYETVWLRQFAIVFGTSEQALSVVLGTYMGGLAIGSIVASKTAHRIRRPLLTYGLLELGIAVGAMLVPVGLMAVRWLQVILFAGSDEPPAAGNISQILYFFLAAFAVTIIPTGMMGATLPFLARHVVHRDEQLGRRIGALYATNVLGAVLGTIAAAFVFLPWFGLSRTVLIGVSVNVAVFLVVCLLLRSTALLEITDMRPESDRARSDPREPGLETVSDRATNKPRKRSKRRRGDRALAARRGNDAKSESDSTLNSADRDNWILPLIACSGAISFAYEILFTRMLGHFLGGSVFSFASMLASFLIGIALGASIASRIAGNKRLSKLAFVYTQVGTALLALCSWYLIGFLADHVNAQAAAGEQMPRALLAILVLLPPAVTIGMTFPLAIRIHARDEHDAATSSAKVYAWNTVGGVVGAFLTGTYLLPLTNYELTLSVALIANMMLALSVILVASVRPVHFLAPVCVLFALVYAFPKRPDELLRASAFPGKVHAGELVFVKTGRSSTVTLHHRAGKFTFATNGLPEAGSVPKGWVLPSPVPVWLGVLPCIVHPEAESMLVMGLGSGVAATCALESVKEIDVFELEEGVVEANRLISDARSHDPIADRRIKLIMNDGRSGLAMTRKKYDAIVSQPSHPWTAGASHLYTHEFAQLVKEHLIPQGVFVQWMDGALLDLEMFRSLGANLLDVFPYVQLYQPRGGTLLFVARNDVPRQQFFTIDDRNDRDRRLLQKLGIDSAESILPLLSLDHPQMETLCSGAPLITDDNNLMALRMKVLEYGSPSQRALIERINQLDPFCDPANPAKIGWVDRSYVARRRLKLLRPFNAEAVAKAEPNPSRRSTIEGYLKLRVNEHAEGVALLARALQQDPGNATARCLLQLTSVKFPSMLDESARRLASSQSLPPELQALIDATRDLQGRRLDDMPRLDAALAKISPSDLLYPAAMQLRINLRLQSPDAQSAQLRGREALQLINQAWPHGDVVELLLARAIAAGFADQPLELIASAQMLAQEFSPKDDGSGEHESQAVTEDPTEKRLLLEHCLAAMKRFEGDPRVQDGRYYGVRLLLLEAINAGEQP